MYAVIGVWFLTAVVAAMPLVISVSWVIAEVFTRLAIIAGVGPNVLANRATALVTADDVRSCTLLSAVGSLRLSAGARPSETVRGE